MRNQRLQAGFALLSSCAGATCRHARTCLDAFAFAAGTLFRYAPVSGTALIGFAVVEGAAAPLSVWAINGLVEALAQTSAAGAALPTDRWPPILPWLALLGATLLFRGAEQAGSLFLARHTRERIDG
ncbi:MAG TPA: hypothetical protein VGW38_20080, partial [Chloroflexota bacterium]|nr:hypothetical protein [Chloroflexota bacterium]